MTNGKHTQGPWRINSLSRIEGVDYGLIASVRGDLSDQTTHANARLIAAAPRLLRALAELHDACLLGGLSGTHPAMVDAAVAVADATGEAPLTTAA